MSNSKQHKPPNFPIFQGNNYVFQKFLHKAAMFQLRISPIGGENLMEKLITIDIVRDRIGLDGLRLPSTIKAAEGLMVEEAKKVLRVVQMEIVKERLKFILFFLIINWVFFNEKLDRFRFFTTFKMRFLEWLFTLFDIMLKGQERNSSSKNFRLLLRVVTKTTHQKRLMLAFQFWMALVACRL